MVNGISLKKAQDFRRKSMLTGMRYLQENVSAGKMAEEYARSTNSNSKATTDKSKDRQS